VRTSRFLLEVVAATGWSGVQSLCSTFPTTQRSRSA
jgi:hypothetical protein